MQTKIKPRKPAARCYRCGDREVATVCHHCGRPMCTQHSPPSRRGRFKLRENPEFEKLGLENTPFGTAGVHCEHCQHEELNYWRLSMVASLILLISGTLLFLRELDHPGMVFLAFGTFLAGFGYSMYRQRYLATPLGKRPPVPLLPHYRTLQIREVVKSHVSLNTDGQYRIEDFQHEGAISVQTDFTEKDQERCAIFHSRYRLTAKDNTEFHAGFIVLNGCAETTFTDDHDSIQHQLILPVTGRINDEPFLTAEAPPHNDQVIRTYRYQIASSDGAGDRCDSRLPVHLVASIMHKADRHELRLDLHWRPSAFPKKDARLESIDALHLQLPETLGNLKQIIPRPITNSQNTDFAASSREASRTILWENVALTPDEHEARCKTFQMHFDTEVDRNTQLTGTLHVGFVGGLSGIEDAESYDPLGRPRGNATGNVETSVKLDFGVDLANLHDQTTIGVKQELPSQNLGPGYLFVTELVKNMSCNGFYVKRVIENPAYGTRTSAHVANRVWELAGRKYEGLCPLDFYLVLTGEVNDHDTKPQSGETQGEITIRSIAINDKVRPQIEELLGELKRLISKTTDDLTRSAEASSAEDTASDQSEDTTDDEDEQAA